MIADVNWDWVLAVIRAAAWPPTGTPWNPGPWYDEQLRCWLMCPMAQRLEYVLGIILGCPLIDSVSVGPRGVYIAFGQRRNPS